MNTINPPGDEEHCARASWRAAGKCRLQGAYHQLSSKRASLVATIGGSSKRRRCASPATSILCRWVQQNGKWIRFAADTDAGKLYGRGTSDMKSGVAAFVLACVNLSGNWSARRAWSW